MAPAYKVSREKRFTSFPPPPLPGAIGAKCRNATRGSFDKGCAVLVAGRKFRKKMVGERKVSSFSWDR